jgi:3-hydroxyacyl-CoA dehydrogenase
MVNEGARILAEGKATRASDIDIIWVLGYGWPAHRGGPMHWAGDEGIARISGRLDQLAETLGDQFRPAPLLAEIAASGGRFV